MGKIYDSLNLSQGVWPDFGGNEGGGSGILLWAANKKYKENDIVRLGNSLFLAIHDNINSQPCLNKDGFINWNPIILNDPVQTSVPEHFESLTFAIKYFETVSSSAGVTIIVSGIINDSKVMVTNSRINCVTISGGVINIGEENGISAVGAGVNVAIKDVQFKGAGATINAGEWTNNCVAAFSLNGAHMTLTNVHSEGVYYGAQAARASITGDRCVFEGAGDAGVLAFNGGQISLKDCASNRAYDSKNALGWGYVAEDGGALWLQGCSSEKNVQGGLFANIGGHIRDDNGKHLKNVRAGVVRSGSNIEVNGTDLSSSDSTNFEVIGGNLSGYNSHFDGSINGNGIFVSGGGRVYLQNCSTNDNALLGIQATQVSMVKLNNTHSSTGNGKGGMSPAINQLSADGALISQ